eukprot:CAMPEP_0183327788 /NCGR_PEP_ID=MMETSP0160_2-20130417/83946_1 /TAXON_ID=2839 ORGANISM="Odontella Sinensis, Strain Grunow 1884" /NCGR_SAMPLE_ID=MMETSP0160_2 /ASSEMBLY_ACC=CAM_ASM_000250 /LENGTH=390 /DNA_ID=CAMNT_0025495933 /DNA_START=754 /DNA_END=1926 /DNA_ORIENTATION=+
MSTHLTDDSTTTGSKIEKYWLPPPSVEPLVVDFRCACYKLSHICTVGQTADVKFVIIFEWFDERLEGKSLTTNDLPRDLWGPDCILENAQVECEVGHDSFSLLNPETGRLKRSITFHGRIFTPFDLDDFPFDSDDLKMKFISISNWRTLDGTRFGNDPVKRLYTLCPMLNDHTVDFFTVGWNGKVNEFQILGWNHEVIHPPMQSKPIIFKFEINITRKANFYYLKIFAPLWLLVLTSLAAYTLETDDLGSRYEFLVTVLLTTVAFVYIVQELLPKKSLLTVVDKVVVCSMTSVTASVFFSFLISILPNPGTANIVFAIANQVVYWLTNIILIMPPHKRQQRHKAEILARDKKPELKTLGPSCRSSIVRFDRRSSTQLVSSMMKSLPQMSK